MKHLKLFESFNSHESLKDEISDLFIDFEDELGMKVNVSYSKIVLGRDDWMGNFSIKVRHIWGGDFINYTENTIMSSGDEIWEEIDSFTVRISKLNYIKELTNDSIVDHWNNLDDDLRKRILVISERAKRLGLDLFGVHGTWYQLGKALHDDFIDKPYYGWDVVNDCIVFAFLPIKKTNEGLFDFFRKKSVPEFKPYELSEPLYQQISLPEMVEYDDNHITVPFSKFETDYINGLLGKVKYRIKMGTVPEHFFIETKNENITITKYDDEWF